MTALVEADTVEHEAVGDDAPRTGSARHRIPADTRSWWALFGLCACALLAAVFSAHAFAPHSSRTYAQRGAVWVQPSVPGRTAWFRTTMDFDAQPKTAVLLADANDQVQLWINGRPIGTNRLRARAGAKPEALVADIRAYLTAGSNVIAAQVDNLSGSGARMWASVQGTRSDGRAFRADTGSAVWHATSEAKQTGIALGGPASFSTSAFVPIGWPAAVSVGAVRVPLTTAPAAVFTAVPLSHGWTSNPTASVSAFAVNITATAGRDMWLRVASSGALTMTLKGHTVLSVAGDSYASPNSDRPSTLTSLHLGSSLSTGLHTVSIDVYGARQPALYLDEIQQDGSHYVQRAATSVGVTAANRPDTRALSVRTSVAWPRGFRVAAVDASSVLDAPEPDVYAMWTVVFVAVGLALALALAVLRRTTLGWGVGMVTLAALPSIAAIGLVCAAGRWVTLPAGWAFSGWRPLLVFGVALATALGVGLAWALPSMLGPNRLRNCAVRLPCRIVPRKAAVLAIASFAGLVNVVELGRQPVWQDEATSITVGKAIDSHGLPQLGSGLFYFKGELYHAVLALLLAVTDNVTALRSISLVFFVATVVVFGLLLMPTVAPGRTPVQLGATALFAVLPAETVWARDVRMYQMMQFFAVVFIAYLLRAATTGDRRDIRWSALAMLGMYLSHEESFVLLPAVAALAVVSGRVLLSRWRTVALWYGPVSAVIALQYVVSSIHPVAFGTDLSNRPYVGWDPDQSSFYYTNVYFSELGRTPSLTVLSLLALAGIAVAVRMGRRPALLLGLLLVASAIAVSLLFTAKVDRYSFVTVPMVVALAGLTVGDLFAAVRRPARKMLGRRAWSVVLAPALALLVSMNLVVASAATPADFGMVAARTAGAPDPLRHLDYRGSLSYLRSHLQPGDAVITLSAPVLTSLYLGRAPDAVIQTGTNKLLYLVLRRGQVDETILGAPVVLTAQGLRAFLYGHSRVWLVSDEGSYLRGLPSPLARAVTSAFRLQYAGGGSTVSMWSQR